MGNTGPEMIHDPVLVEKLETFDRIEYSGAVYRATRKGLDPLAPSTRGGRWSIKDNFPTLYTSCSREGAIAEIAFHLGLLSPLPTRPMNLHNLVANTHETLRLLRGEFTRVGIVEADYARRNHDMTQKIGAAVAFLGCDGLIAPSARWEAENLMLFEADGRSIQDVLRLNSSEELDWLAFGRQHGLITDE